MPKFDTRDIVAILVLAICALLLILGIDGEVKAFMGFVIGFYFGRAVDNIKTKKQNASEIPPSDM